MTAQAAQFSTLTVDEPERLARWEEWNRLSLIALSCHTPDGQTMRGEEVNLCLADLKVARVRAARHRVSRNAETVSAAPADSIAVYIALRGKTRFADRTSSGSIVAGEALMTDADLAFEREFPSGFAELALEVPRALYLERFGRTGRSVSDIRRVAGRVALRVQVISRYIDVVASRPARDFDAATLQLVALDLLNDLTGGAAPGDRLALARLVVEQSIGDPTMSATKIGQLLGISDRQLSRMFADSGTSFPSFVTARRLERATTLLTQSSPLPIGDVAAACGFSSASYFCRVFHDQVGMTPQQWRDR
ncbi:MAG: hypothetical protein QOC94_2531 [Actinoplanes sp.]|nr:hypothetical protein [Actinoplanes sp.]